MDLSSRLAVWWTGIAVDCSEILAVKCTVVRDCQWTGSTVGICERLVVQLTGCAVYCSERLAVQLTGCEVYYSEKLAV